MCCGIKTVFVVLFSFAFTVLLDHGPSSFSNTLLALP